MYATAEHPVVGNMVEALGNVLELLARYQRGDAPLAFHRRVDEEWQKVRAHIEGEPVNFLADHSVDPTTNRFRGMIKFLFETGMYVEYMHERDPSAGILHGENLDSKPYTDYYMDIQTLYADAHTLMTFGRYDSDRLLRDVFMLWQKVRLLPEVGEGLEQRLHTANG